jgi:anaerobic dimethyl sulfoxide reductase subunit C (anchor subunit)
VANWEEVAAGPPGLHEPTLVAFTLLAQTAVGMLWALVATRWIPAMGPGSSIVASPDIMPHAPLAVSGALAIAALAVSLLHLGRPGNAWRSLGNLRTSWLSREILFMSLFTVGWAGFFLLEVLGASASIVEGVALGTGAVGVALVYAMGRVYRLRTVPSWDSVRTTLGFLLTALILGTLTVLWVGEIFTYFGPGGERRALDVGVAGSALGVAALAAVRSRTWFYARHRRVGV